MFTPDSFRETDIRKIHDFIERHSFGVLITQRGAVSEATHLPLLLDREVGTSGQLVGHMARANSQWEDADGKPVLAIFNGPHAYISPAWYEEQNVVPTWNYVAVHVYGTLRLLTEEQQMLEVLRKYVTFYEASLPKPWSIDAPEPEFITRLAAATVAFYIDIERIEGKWKLSQNHTRERRERVIRTLLNQESPASQRIADLMSETLRETDS